MKSLCTPPPLHPHLSRPLGDRFADPLGGRRVGALVALLVGVLATPLLAGCLAEETSPQERLAAAAVSLSPIELPVDPTIAAWVQAQNTRSRAYLAGDPALQAALRTRAAELAPQNAQVRTNFFGTDYYVSRGSLFSAGAPGTPDRLLVNAAALPAGAAVSEFRVSPDQQKLAYGYQISGSDWTTWHAVSLADLSVLAGPFYIKSSGVDEMTWTTDSRGLFYEGWLTAADDVQGRRLPQVKLHTLGTDPASDEVVFEDDEQPHTVKYNAQPIDPNTAVIYRVLGGAEVPLAVHVSSRAGAGHPWTSEPIVLPRYTWGRYVGRDGRKLLLRVSRAGRYAIAAVDLDTRRWQTIVPEHAHDVLLQAQQIGERLVLQYLDGQLRNRLVVTDLSGATQLTFSPSDVGLPDVGTLSLLTGTAQSAAGYFTYSATDTPTETLKLDAASASISRLPGRPLDFDGARVQTALRWYPAADGTSIPIQVFTRADVAAPSFAYLFVYGNIGVANLSSWNRKFQLMLELGGMVAIANVRGGGERGLGWQLTGVFNKWKTLGDIARASRWLKASYPSISGRVALSGRSYGGMMTMSEYVHFQDDFSVFTPVVGVSDPVALLDQEVGWVYGDDLGYPRDPRGHILSPWRSSDEMLRSYSPMHGVASLRQTRPILAFSAQHDTRVTSWQTGRFIHALAQRFGADAPAYLIEHENVGHNGRAELVDEAVFIARQFGVTALSPLRRPQ